MNYVRNRKVQFSDLGLIDYKQAWDYQTSLFDRIVAKKIENRSLAPDRQQPTDNHLLFCEHPHVYTLGRTGDEKNLLIQNNQLDSIGATYFHTNRGGDITYHGPGQIVVYPVLDLENFFTDIHLYMRTLEESVIQTLADYNIMAGRVAGLTGVWIEGDGPRARKICALGVKTSRWVTMHGLAFNVNTDLNYFHNIVPCGIDDKEVTSMAQETGSNKNIDDIKTKLKEKIVTLFEMSLLN